MDLAGVFAARGEVPVSVGPEQTSPNLELAIGQACHVTVRIGQVQHRPACLFGDEPKSAPVMEPLEIAGIPATPYQRPADPFVLVFVVDGGDLAGSDIEG